MRQIFYATTVTALIAAAVACSDNNPKGDAGPGQQVCPSTIQAATSTAAGSEGTNNSCHVDLYICVVGFQCNNFTQQATCTCDGTTGKFTCLLSNGDTVPDDTTDSSTVCTALADAGKPDTCPTTVKDAKDAQGNPVACTNAGQICPYATTCTTQPPPQDTCQCKGNISGSPGLVWECDVHQCP